MNGNTESCSDLCRGPFSATKLWNEVVRQMKQNVPVKRRRWRMKVFEDAFVASEALDWLHGFLKESPNFGADVTRQQAVQLCIKFLKNGIISDARGKRYNGTFEDNSHLYRFTEKARYSPYKATRSSKNEKPVAPRSEARTALVETGKLNTIYQDEIIEESEREHISTPSVKTRVYNLRSNPLTTEPSRTPLVNKLNVLSASKVDPRGSIKSTGGVKRRRSSRQESLKEVIMNPAAFIAHNRRSLTENEINQVWWNIATVRLRRLMDLDDSFVNTLRVEDYDISCVRCGAQDQRTPKAGEVLPQWLVSAMKCLIHWPNGDYSKQSFPKYAGFERDVFKAIVEFFGTEERCPLVPSHLLGAFRKTVDFLFKCKLTAMRSLQYCCLLIPVKNRELLQVLLKFMVRLLDNHSISLSDDLLTKELVGGETTRVTVPKEGPTMSFCERITPQEYKEQTLITSQRSLKDLLSRIVEDESVSEKERRKQLKQFEKSYPDIYQAKFPGDNFSTCSQTSQSIVNYSDPKDRMIAVVRWYLSAFHAGRKGSVAKKPYNPILGETFRCFWVLPECEASRTERSQKDGPLPWISEDDLSFIAEQVSHHPPISAFYAENFSKNITFNAHIWTKSKFLGLSVGVENIGQGCVSVLPYDEDYVLTFPNGYGRSILTVPWIEIGGKTNITCAKTGYEATVQFHCRPFYGGKKHRITCEIISPEDKKSFATITGEWNGQMFAKYADKEEPELFIDTLTLPVVMKTVKKISKQEENESRRLWKDVTDRLKLDDVESATASKHKLEERQRAEARERKEKGVAWETKLFHEVGENWVYDKPLVKRLANQKQ